MKTPCKTSYWCFIVCRWTRMYTLEPHYLQSVLLWAVSCEFLFSVKIRYCFHLCQHLSQSAQTFSLRNIIKYCTSISSPTFQNLYPFVLRQDKATHRWKKILISRTAIARARQFLSKLRVYSYWVHVHFICSNSCDLYTHFANRRTSVFFWVTNHASKGLC